MRRNSSNAISSVDNRSKTYPGIRIDIRLWVSITWAVAHPNKPQSDRLYIESYLHMNTGWLWAKPMWTLNVQTSITEWWKALCKYPVFLMNLLHEIYNQLSNLCEQEILHLYFYACFMLASVLPCFLRWHLGIPRTPRTSTYAKRTAWVSSEWTSLLPLPWIPLPSRCLQVWSMFRDLPMCCLVRAD